MALSNLLFIPRISSLLSCKKELVFSDLVIINSTSSDSCKSFTDRYNMDQVLPSSIVQSLNVNVYGGGTQTLVLSRFGVDQSVWYYMIPYLACFFKVIVYDLAFAYNAEKYSNFDAYASDLMSLMNEIKRQ
ncbi:hypothetical protein SAY87_017708 [Trapa incisa]|uniref:Uncharacterized protein n=1 Tax=Trapa incisa TaxID=236973 RepID=A0AAN7L239_9MYRT|nr:hypothetical protein SAY87_017708 [Trapa incisa]